MELLRQLAPHTAAHSTHSTQQQQATTQHDSTQHGTAAAAGIHTDMHQGASGSRNSLPKQGKTSSMCVFVCTQLRFPTCVHVVVVQDCVYARAYK